MALEMNFMAIERTGAAKEHFEKAEGNFKNQAYEKAIAEYGEVIKLLPNDAESYYLRGCCYSGLEQKEKQLDDYSKAISIEPQNGNLCFVRSDVYLKLGETEKAIADVEKGVELAGTDEETIALRYWNLGYLIFELTGDKRTAAVYYKKSVEHGDVKGGGSQRKLDEWRM